MGVAISLLVIACGAAMVWATDASWGALSLYNLGLVLMPLGAISLVLAEMGTVTAASRRRGGAARGR